MLRALPLLTLIATLVACSNKSGPPPSSPRPLTPPLGAQGYYDSEPDYVVEGQEIVDQEQIRIERGQSRLTDRPQANCGQSFVTQDKTWFPGLPWAPLTKPRATGLTSGAATYTDAGRDRLLPFAISQMQGDGEENPAAREFATQIDDVSVYTELQTGAIEARFVILGEEGKPTPVTLRGRFRGASMQDRVNVVLNGNRGFAGRATCADVTGGCENILLTIKRLGVKGETLAEAKVVHRYGSAHVQIAPADQYEFAKYQNPAHRIFAEYLSNTVNNACLAVLYAVKTGQRQEEACTIDRLQRECGSSQVRYPSAKVFAMRTWAVVYGRSGFEFNAQDKESRMSGPQKGARFLIAGPLLTSAAVPAAPSLHVEGAIGVLKADLVANDGAGSLNLQLVFAGEPRSHTRLSIATLFERTRRELQGNGVAAATPDWLK